MKTRIFNLIILDESGSMYSIAKQAIDGVNETLQSVRAAQKKHDDQEHIVSFVTFNSDKITTTLDRVEASCVEDITPEQYHPSCSTPLYDAIGQSVNALSKHVGPDDKVLVTIITDGYENASHEYTQMSIKALTENLGKQGWTFAYIGANQDAKAVSKDLGIKNAMNFEASIHGTIQMTSALTSSRERWYDRIANMDVDADENFFEDNQK